ncbi:HEAT repeat domain-containing protein [Nocardia sp. NPDC051750]|uniref:HEAT repeat domain-containing protein n=1 Tax=Nocardia sp. NPDC051750 TaxID=3364325 RepID=UPI00379AE21A
MTPTDDASATRLLADYRQAGGYGSTIPEIFERGPDSIAVIDVLAEWLIELETRWPGPETEGRGLARSTLSNALGGSKAAARKSTKAVPALISQFDPNKEINPYTRWAAGNAIYDIPAGIQYFDQLAAIAADRSFGMERQLVVNWLGKSQHPDAAAIAVAQLDEEIVRGHALEALARLRAQGVSKQVEPFLSSKNKWWRRTAERIVRYDQG